MFDIIEHKVHKVKCATIEYLLPLSGMRDELIVCKESTIKQVLNAAFEIHNEFGSGMLESVYERALIWEMENRGFETQRQVKVPVLYKGNELGPGFRADIIVARSLLIEVKALKSLLDVHVSQVVTYLKLLKFKRGLLLNFGSPSMKDGIKRVAI